MPLDGITAKCLAGELSSSLAGARVDRIYQPDRFDIFLHLRAGGSNQNLLLSANPTSPRLQVTRETRDNPSEPPMFCMLLRKHLLGARLIDVVTPDYERIFQIRFQAANELGDQLEKRLVVEIMGRHSNIILLNQENRILDAVLHVDQSISRVREIMPARTYVLPPDQKKMTPREVLDRLDQDVPWLNPASGLLGLDKALLQTLQGFSPQLCQEIIYQSGLDARIRFSQLDPTQILRLNQALRIVLTLILENRFVPSVFYDSPQADLPLDFHALPLQSLAIRKSAGSMSQAMDLYYLERSRQNNLKQKKQSMGKAISAQLEHVRKKLNIHESDRAEGKNRDKYRVFGELILSGIHQIAPGQSEWTTNDYHLAGEPSITIPLQPNLTASQNAQRYFRLYAKARAKSSTGTRLAAEDREEISYLEALQNALAVAIEPEDLQAIRQELAESSWQHRQAAKPEPAAASRSARRTAGKGNAKPQALPPRRYISSDGLVILVGRNNLQNDLLTLKTAQKDDLWLHVQKMPGTHVIIRANRQPVPGQTLHEAAETAAWFSRATLAGESKVAVDYCPVSHVRKPPGARPGMVIYDRYQTILVVPKDPQALAGSAP